MLPAAAAKSEAGGGGLGGDDSPSNCDVNDYDGSYYHASSTQPSHHALLDERCITYVPLEAFQCLQRASAALQILMYAPLLGCITKVLDDDGLTFAPLD